MNKQTNIQALAAAIATIKRFDDGTALPHADSAHFNAVRFAWEELRDAIMRDAPSGSGIDSGTTLAEQVCGPNRIELYCEFHHMDDHGTYDGWTRHPITVTPAFDGITVKVGGRDRNGIKDYLADVYHTWATAPCAHKFTMPTLA